MKYKATKTIFGIVKISGPILYEDNIENVKIYYLKFPGYM